MRWNSLALLLACFVTVIPNAFSREPKAPRPSGPQGAGYVYLAPFEGEARRLHLRLDGLLAVREDGTSIEIALSTTEIDGREWTRERRLATGALPGGSYRGLALRVASADTEGEEGRAELVTPEEPVEIPVPFSIRKRQAAVLVLRLDGKISIEDDFRFTPRFIANQRPRPAVGLLGLASDRGSDTVTLFNKSTAEVVGVIPTGSGPAGIALDQRRRHAFVALSGDDAVVEIGLLEYQILNRTRLQGGDAPLDLALTPDGETLLTANVGSRSVSLIDASSLAETRRVQVGDEPRGILVDGGGNRAYVFNTASSSVSVIDIREGLVVATIGTQAGPFRGRLNRDEDALYVIHRFSPYVTVIDPEDLAVTGRLYVGPGVTDLDVDVESNFVYIARRGSGAIEIYDPLSSLPVGSIEVGDDVSSLTLDLELDTLHALFPGTRELRVFNVVDGKLRGRADLGEGSYWVVVNGER